MSIRLEGNVTTYIRVAAADAEELADGVVVALHLFFHHFRVRLHGAALVHVEQVVAASGRRT